MRRYLLCLPLLAAAPVGGQAMEDVDHGVSMQLALEAPPVPGEVRLQVVLENHGRRPALVPRAVASMDRLLGNVFTVRNAATGEPVPYVGPMVKRGPLTAADYLVLKPGQRHAHVIDIGPAYDFRPGTHAYEVSYAGHYITDARALVGAGAPGLPLAAQPVAFRFSR
ncbi:hypothetical protein [Pseudoduganella lutea]|uniref:Uncharacterized protein n=1 Tax=Pseudoduganella lutea TaxID=321985 RepID=A0A4P6L4E9_9BURK|nr:hypothetical protein [Pseudoduganella lutea]QBE66481.1 hypothetical protein EWM63_28850 [Pseudoduganella lutea]